MKAKLFFILLCAATSLHAQRVERTINDGWRFVQGNAAATLAAPDSVVGELVQLPHSWNSDAYVSKNYYRGEGWYFRTLSLSEADLQRRLLLHFEAANHSATLYVNGSEAGTHHGGYTAFAFDITALCRAGSNAIAVRVSNEHNGYVLPLSGDFTIFGGIYRDVWLVSVPQQHFSFAGGAKGVFATTPKVSAGEAQWQVSAALRNDSDAPCKLIVEHELLSPDGKKAGAMQQTVTLAARTEQSLRSIVSSLKQPLLWSPEAPNLYRLRTVLRDAKSGRELDKVSASIGFRWFNVDAEKGFFLNGKHYKLRGICRHQDQQPQANALSDEQHRRDIRLAKEMGANFIRISHYPQDEAVVEQCDRLGIIAWEEIPIIDITHPDPQFDTLCHTSLREMVRQHYNHPSIVMWGYMNEVMLRRRLVVGHDTILSNRAHILALAQSLEKQLKADDPARLSTIAFGDANYYYEAGLGHITDLVGWNIYTGWYGGQASNIGASLERKHREHPDRPMMVSEYGAGSDRRLHSLQPRIFDFSIEYQQQYLEAYIPAIERYDYVLGGAQWNFVDFGSAVRDESMPRINNKGLFYADRTPKDVYYLFKAAWRNDLPVLHIASRDWAERVTVSDTAVAQPIKIYTNLPSVELLVNGVSQGQRSVENHTATFHVKLGNGTYSLVARGESAEDVMLLRSTLVPLRLASAELNGLELAVNVGSSCSYTAPHSGLTWLPDQPYAAGSWGYVDGRAHRSQTQVMGTADNPLYQTLRDSLTAYRFDLPDGDYELELLLADLFNKASNVVYQLGAQQNIAQSTNKLRLLINGAEVDVLQPALLLGFYRATTRRYLVQARGGQGIVVTFEALQGRAFLNGIKVRLI
ncbi:MAG: DUF4982 domain-containing protein [Prevotellaceae bacterium]|nr:DUF4982 domain-containing protein [Prevotellaceae bacterium]